MISKNKNTVFLFISLIVIIIIYKLLPVALFNIGKYHYNSSNYSIAYYFLKYAFLNKPDNNDYKYFYIKTLCELKPTYGIQKELFNVSISDNEDSAVFIAKTKVIELKNIILHNYGENYISQAPFKSTIIRWNNHSFPLKIYIQFNNNSQNYYINAVDEAVNQWEKALNFVSFRITDNKRSADIHIIAIDNPQAACSNGNCRYVKAYTIPEIKNNKLKKMKIYFYNKDINNNLLTQTALQNIILHELGHALGILGHSYSSEDLMYQYANQPEIYSKFNDDMHYINFKDINTIKLLYNIAPTISNKYERKNNLIYAPIIFGKTDNLTDKKIIEANKFIQLNPDNITGYINLSNLYIQKEEYNKAINILKISLNINKTRDEEYLIYYNLATCYMNIGNITRARDYAILAKNVTATPEIIEILSILNTKKDVK